MSSVEEPHARADPLLHKLLDQPWRYRCPDCDSTNVRCRGTAGRGNPLNYREGREAGFNIRANHQDEIHVHEFRCGSCNALFDEPIDQKTGEPANYHELREELR